MGSVSKINPVYFIESKPSEGGNIPAGKPDTCDDALGRPSRYTRNATTVATECPDSHVQSCIDKQVGTNMTLAWGRTKES